MENDYIYVGYVLNDYAHACWMSRNKAKVQKEIDKYKASGGWCATWIERYSLKHDNLIELNAE